MRVANNNPLLARQHWGTIVEAGLALAAASAATRLLSSIRYIGLDARPLDRAKPIVGNETSRIKDALGRRAPFRGVCCNAG